MDKNGDGSHTAWIEWLKWLIAVANDGSQWLIMLMANEGQRRLIVIADNG